MKIIIVGLGIVGEALVGELSVEGHDVVGIDKDANIIENIINVYDVNAVCGNGASEKILREAGVASADILIACTDFDEVNILCCMEAKHFGAKSTIARVSNPEYFKLFKHNELGLTMLINPEYETALNIARILRTPNVNMIEPFAGGKVDLLSVNVTEDSIFKDIALVDLPKVLGQKLLVALIQRGNEYFIPKGDFVLKQGDIVTFASTPKKTTLFFKKQKKHKIVHKVLIVGGSKIAYHLMIELSKIGIDVKIIDNDKNKCDYLIEHAADVEVVLGDGTDPGVLLDEGLTNYDAFISLMGSDEQNMVTSLFAQSKNPKIKVITKLDKLTYSDMLHKGGIDSIVSSKQDTVDEILRYVRSVAEVQQSSMNKLFRLGEGSVEAIEFTVTEDFKKIGVPLKELNNVNDTLALTIIRNDEVITPNGDDVFLLGDTVLIITMQKNVDELNDLIK